jgi:glutathione S-transferase
MTKPEIIGSLRSTYTRVVCMACEEKGIDYVLTETRLGAPEIFAIHPLGKMPVLRHGDLVLFESKAIATYLDRSFAGPQLIPADPYLAGLTEQWVSFVNTAVDRTLIRTYLYAYIKAMMTGEPPDRVSIDAVVPDMRKQIDILDRAVTRTGYLAGEHITLADLNLLPILDSVVLAPEGAEAVAAAAHLSHYFETHKARPSFLRTAAVVGPPEREPARA